MGGSSATANYRAVCTGSTGHAEVVQLQFDPAQVSFELLLEMFFQLHDPTTLNRQGNDVGTQYRSGVYTYSPAQRAAAERSRTAYAAALAGRGLPPITTEITPTTTIITTIITITIPRQWKLGRAEARSIYQAVRRVPGTVRVRSQ